MTERHYRGRYDTVDLSRKAIRIANWQDQVARQISFSSPVPLESVNIHDGQALFFARALLALTKPELDHLYAELLRAHQDCLRDGGDFTSNTVRAALPHLYGTEPR